MNTKPLNYIKDQKNSEAQKTLDDTNPVYAQKQSDIIELINRYWMSRYKHSDYDGNRKKVFFNIIESPVFVAAKRIDLDTKDVRVVPEDRDSIKAAWFLGKDLKMWMKETEFSKFLNKIKYWLPKYGSVVAKKTKDEEGINKVSLVPLENFYVQADAESLRRSHFVIEQHDYLPRNLRKRDWDNVEMAIDEHEDKRSSEERKKGDNERITVYEFYGEMPGHDENFFIIADVGDDGVILHKEEDKDLPYKELHWDKQSGRWLGVGQVEKTFEAQIHMNKVANMKADALKWTSKLIFQAPGGGDISNDLLNEVPNGAVLTPNKQITQVANEERNLAAYREEEQRWLQNVKERSFASELMRGKTPPSGVPLGSARLAAQESSNFFAQKREEFGIFIKDIINDWIIPSFKKEKRQEHVLNIIGGDSKDLEKFDKMMLKYRTKQRIKDFIAREGTFPMPTQIDMFKKLEQRKLRDVEERFTKVPEKFYENAKYKIDVDITGEGTDTAGKIQALQTAMQTTQDPEEKKELRDQLLSLLGIEPSKKSSTGGGGMADILQQAAQKQQNTGSPPRTRQPSPQPQQTTQTETV